MECKAKHALPYTSVFYSGSSSVKCSWEVLSTNNQRVGCSIQHSAYAPRHGTATVSLDPGVGNGYQDPGRNLFLEMLQRKWQQGLKPVRVIILCI